MFEIFLSFWFRLSKTTTKWISYKYTLKLSILRNILCKDLVWNCQTPAILWFSRIDRDPRLLSPAHVVPLKKQKNMPDPMGEGLARDEAMNHGQ